MPAAAAAVAAPSHLRGIALMIGAFSLLPLTDAIAKDIIRDYHLIQVVWGRMFFQTLAVFLGLLLSGKLRRLRTRRWRLQAFGATAGWAANFPFILALAYLPLADVFALGLVAPLMVTALSVPLLGETVGRHRWAAVAAGFAGTLVILRPGLGIVHWASFLPLLAAACFAFYQISARRLGATESPLTTLFYASAVALALSTLLVPFVWTAPDGRTWLLMAAMGGLAGLGHFAIISALGSAPASLLAPFIYVQLVSSAVIGLLVFGDFPGGWTIAGGAIVTGAGLYLALRERRAIRAAAAPAA